jgi:phosphoserine phosphatase
MGANETLGLPFQDDGKMQKIAICFDVDGTLIDETFKEYERVARLVIAMSTMFKNSRIVIWSGGGNAYAQQQAERLALSPYVWKYMSKHQHTELRALGYRILAIDDIQDTAIGDLNLIVRNI